MTLSEKKLKQLEKYGYKPAGDKPLARKVVAIRLPEELYEHVCAQKNKNQWLTAAVAAKYAAENNYHKETTT